MRLWRQRPETVDAHDDEPGRHLNVYIDNWHVLRTAQVWETLQSVEALERPGLRMRLMPVDEDGEPVEEEEYYEGCETYWLLPVILRRTADGIQLYKQELEGGDEIPLAEVPLDRWRAMLERLSPE
ncbi:MAG: hypothetical protein HN976_08765 [Lentisphaerae bacterium]|nr:hypothetical protein [Lentisphaerota bacterium]MBT4814089.1 hypothetical protein [Lentisphaerota bacterium]MBT7055166.1 hypothetical protein [Lentisphaerota bacterium]